MKILNLHKKVIKELREEDKLNKSEGSLGALYYLNEKEQLMVKNYESTRKVLVYHIIHSFSNLGETYDLLYITQYKEDWNAEKEDLKNGYALSRTEVIDFPPNSESGIIGIESRNGGIVRIC